MERSRHVKQASRSRKRWTSIVDVVTRVLKKTEELANHLHKGLPEQDRDSYIEKTALLFEERAALLNELKMLTTGAKPPAGKEILSLNDDINSLLKKQARILKGELDTFIVKQQRQKKYTNYDTLAADGMYFDKKN